MADKKTTKYYEYHPTIYPRYLWLVVGDWSIADENFCYRNGNKLVVLDGDYIAGIYKVIHKESGNYGELFYIPSYEYITSEVIAHEGYHIAADIAKDMGINEDFDNQEPLAYLVGWAGKCIGEVYHKEEAKHKKLKS